MINYTQKSAESYGYKVTYKTEKFKYDGSSVTTCWLSVGNHIIAIGISICSPKDSYDRIKGNTIACGRAMKAAISGISSGEMKLVEKKYGNKAFVETYMDIYKNEKSYKSICLE